MSRTEADTNLGFSGTVDIACEAKSCEAPTVLEAECVFLYH